jgi:hypothetical protein
MTLKLNSEEEMTGPLLDLQTQQRSLIVWHTADKTQEFTIQGHVQLKRRKIKRGLYSKEGLG